MQKCDGHQSRHTEIQKSLLVLPPRALGGIVQKTRHHADYHQHQINAILHGKRNKQHRRHHEGQHKDNARPSGLACGEFAVMGKIPPRVLGQIGSQPGYGDDGRQKRKQDSHKRGEGSIALRYQPMYHNSFPLFPYT